MTQPPIDPTDPRLPALDRLALSRERLRGALQELTPPPHAPQDDGPSVLMTALMSIPGVNVIVDSVRTWWSQHPLHLATLVAGNTARQAVEPIAKRNPFALVAVAMAICGVLYWVKPWRGLLKPALLAGIVPHLISRAMDRVPLESWLAAVSTFVAERTQASAAAGTAPASPATGHTAPAPEQASPQAPMATSAGAQAKAQAGSDSFALPTQPGTLH